MSTTALVITVTTGYFLVGLATAFLVEVFGTEPLDTDEFALITVAWCIGVPLVLIIKAFIELHRLAQRARRKRNTRIDMDYFDRVEEETE